MSSVSCPRVNHCGLLSPGLWGDMGCIGLPRSFDCGVRGREDAGLVIGLARIASFVGLNRGPFARILRGIARGNLMFAGEISVAVTQMVDN